MKKWEKYTKEELQDFCDEVFSYAGLAEKIGYNKTGGSSIKTVKDMIDELSLDVSHFTHQSWNKGKTKETDSRIKSMEKYSIDEIFVLNSPVSHKVMRGYVERHHLLEYKCQKCGCDGQWQDGTIALEIHHINGNNKDNRLENLEYLCPNCHALTDTYAGRNKGKKDKITWNE